MMRFLFVLIALAIPAGAQSDHARDLVQGHVDKIAQCEAALMEIERQSAERLAELGAWRAFYAGAATEAVDTFIKVWRDHHKKTLDRVRKQWSTAKALGRQMKDWVSIPHFNARMFDLKRGLDETEKAVAGWEAAIAKKAVDLRISFIGTIRDIAVKAKGIDAAAAKIRDQVSKGEYRIQYPGLGEVWRNRLQGMIDQEEKAKRQTLDRIAKGEYKTLVPGIGWHTRNSLEAEIDRVTKAIENAQKKLKKGEWVVYRPLFYWKKQKELEGYVKARAEVVQRQQRWRNDPLFKVLLPGAYAWLSSIDVEKKIAEVKKGIGDVEKAVAEGAYKISIPIYGWIDRNAMLKELDSVQRQLVYPKLSKHARDQLNAKLDALRKGLQDVKTLSALDLTIRMLDKTWWTKALGALVSLARPELEGRKLELEQHEAHLGEYTREMNTINEVGRRELQRLKRGLAYIP